MEPSWLRTPLGLLQTYGYGVTKMAETQQQHLSSPPQKLRDSRLTGRSKDELIQNQQEYISATVNSAASESLSQGTMAPAKISIGTDGKEKLCELKKRLHQEDKIVLNIALVYGYDEAKLRKLSADELRSRIGSKKDEEYIDFEIDKPSLEIVVESGIKDIQFIYLNAGIDLLYSRLVKFNEPSEIWK